MLYTIETPHLQAVIDSKGAELQSLYGKEQEIEYIWQGDKRYWGRKAPILFPIVGALKDDQYTYQGKTYEMFQHGFARDLEFELHEQTEDSISFLLTDTPQTKKVYPFSFKLYVSYQLGGDGLIVKYRVENPTTEDLFFSIGGHPGFNVPLEKGVAFEDYYLKASPMKSRIEIPLKGRYIDLQNRTLGQTNTTIALSRALFENDALVFETKGLNSFSICSDQSPHRVTLSFNDLPFVGIWSPYPTEAPFVCIEPWAGVADTVEATGELSEKLGIQKLTAHEAFETKYSITVK